MVVNIGKEKVSSSRLASKVQMAVGPLQEEVGIKCLAFGPPRRVRAINLVRAEVIRAFRALSDMPTFSPQRL